MKKLYKYYEDYGRMGSLEGLLFLDDEQLELLTKHSQALYWWGELGKHSEGYFTFDDTTLTKIELSESTLQELYEEFGSVVSGPLDLGALEDQIAESALYVKEEEDEEDDC